MHEPDLTADLMLSVDLNLTADVAPGFDPQKLLEGEVPEQEVDHPQAPRLDGYRLLEPLRESGAWRARQLNTGQMVSVRVFDQPSPEYLGELRRVVRLGSHPYLVHVLDAQLNHHPPYLVTSWLSSPLSDWMKTRAQAADLNQRCQVWLEQAAHGLAFAHSKGVFHCDIQPVNLWLDSQMSLRLANFGRSHALGGLHDRLPVEGLFLVSPEQLWAHTCPESDRPSPQPGWDLYSLGATFYYLLTSYYPRASLSTIRQLEHSIDLQDRLQEAWVQIHAQRLVPILDLNPSVDVRLALIIERCLQLNPRRGYVDSAALLSDLEEYGAHAHHGLDSACYSLRRLAHRLGF